MTLVRRHLFVILLGSCGLVHSAPISLLRPGDKPSFEIQYDGTDKPLAKWENGYILALDNQPVNAPPISVFGPTGSQVFATYLAIDGFVKVSLRDVAASSSGVFAVSGGALDASGLAVSFIVYLDKKGTITKVVRLEDFVAMRLCFDAENRLWVAGRARDTSQSSVDHDMVRVYDERGLLQRSFLSRTLFATKVHPAKGFPYLVANGKYVVLFSSNTGYVVVMSRAGDVVAIKLVPLPAQTLVSGLAVSETLDIVISAHETSDGKERGIFYALALDTSKWSEIYSREPSGDQYNQVFGFSGESLLVGSYHPIPRFSWVRIR